MKLKFLAALFLSFSVSATLLNAQTVTVPVNDNFADRIELFGTTVATSGNNILATLESESGGLINSGARTVWWTWTAPVTGRVTIDTTGASFDSLINIYSGNSLANLLLIGFNDDGSVNLASSITLNVVQGQTLQICVYGYVYSIGASVGFFPLNLNMDLPVPSNDDFLNRQAIPAGGAVITKSNAGASREQLEPVHAGQLGGESLWYTWTARNTGRVKISSSSPTIPTILGVYSGQGYGALYDASNPINAGIINSTADSLEFTTIGGQTYQIAVDGFQGRVGDITLSVAQGPLMSVTGNIVNGVVGFGRTRVKATKGVLLSITNTGTENLRIKRINFPSGFSAKFSGAISPGETRSIRINFAPKRKGQTGGQVTIVSDSVGGPTTFRVSGTGI